MLISKAPKKTARLIKAEGGVCLVRRTDVTRADDVAGLIDETVNTFDRLDNAVNNAAIEGARIGDHAAEARRLSIALQEIETGLRFALGRQRHHRGYFREHGVERHRSGGGLQPGRGLFRRVGVG